MATTWFGSDVPKPTDDDEVVERVRRMHLNDLENYTPFFFLGLAYAMSKVCQFSIAIVNCTWDFHSYTLFLYLSAQRNRGQDRLRHFRRLPNHAHGKVTFIV